MAEVGQKIVTSGFVLQSAPSPQSTDIRYGLTASRKVGNAIKRNRAKRRLRALATEIFPLHGIQGVDYVLIARQNILTRDFDLLKKDMQNALQQLKMDK